MTVSIALEQRASNDGAYAFRHGRRLEANPHMGPQNAMDDCPLHEAWSDGWEKAKRSAKSDPSPGLLGKEFWALAAKAGEGPNPLATLNPADADEVKP